MVRVGELAGFTPLDDGSCPMAVTDVWASTELLAEFGKTLIPVLKNAGVTPVEPHVQPVHHVIEG